MYFHRIEHTLLSMCASLNETLNIIRVMRSRCCDNWPSHSSAPISYGGIPYDNVIIATKLLRTARLRPTTLLLRLYRNGSANRSLICEDLFIYSYCQVKMLSIQILLNQKFYFNTRRCRRLRNSRSANL